MSDNKEIPPVDFSKRELVSGGPVTPEHRELKANGQQKDYVVLSADERSRGFVRPVRRSYIHVGKDGAGGCGTLTTMCLEIAETYARAPDYYSGTFCCGCAKHLPLDQFVWDGTTEMVGS